MSISISKLASILFYIIAVTNVILSQDSVEIVILSPKVGEVIDSTEREYYGLFRAVKDFSSAVIVQLPNGKFGAQILVNIPTGTDSTFVEIPKILIYQLAERIEHYEELKEGTYIIGTSRPSINISDRKIEWKSKPTTLITKKEKLNPPPKKPVIQVSNPSPKQSEIGLHILLGYVWVITKANDDIAEAFNLSGFSPTSTEGEFIRFTYYSPIDKSENFSWNVAIAYNLTNYLRLGFTINKIPQQEVYGTGDENEYVQGTSYSLLVECIPDPVAPMFTSSSEFAIAAGVSYNSLSVDGKLPSPLSSNTKTFAVKEYVIGLQLRVSYDIYFSRSLSLQIKGEGKIIPPIDVPSVSNTDSNNNVVKTLKQHPVNFSGVDFSIGLRFHL